MRAGRALRVGARIVAHFGLLFGKPVVEGFTLPLLARRHPELVGLAPVIWIGTILQTTYNDFFG